ncbi:hypothetical protein GCM10025863_08820 [Microbacterium suwonense]|uniref:Dihydroorotase n=2 Tax=Microbacterium suwonense TaxID=683047 RepID=A0ABN6X2J3_9MICO|nr:hypothetical protein GCM10025863_08820 [Microbacterium suwonense]
MVGLESALRVVHQSMVETGMLEWSDVARVLSTTPARIGQLDGFGSLEVGRPAHVTLYDPTVHGVFTEADLHGRSRNSPYLGRDLPGRVQWTIHGGVVTVDDGELVQEPGSPEVPQ